MSDQEWLMTSAGVKIPPIIYGTAWKKERTAELVFKALTEGFRGIDTACQPKHYDERLVGEGVQRAKALGIERSALYLQTKFTPLSSQDPDNVPYDPTAPIELQVAQSFERSLDNLQTGYLDCLVLHSPLSTHEQTMDAWRAMERIHASGGAYQLGISNCYEFTTMAALYADAVVKPAVLQNRFYKTTGYDRELRSWCDEQDVIYQSFWSLTANRELLVSATLKEIAATHQKSEAQIFFRYLAHSGIVPLTGTASEAHMRDDLALFDFALSKDEQDYISVLLD